MRALWAAALAVMVAPLTAYASNSPESKPLSSEVPASPIAPSPAQIAAPLRLMSDLDVMRAALPTFDLQRGAAGSQHEREVSVIRDLTFPVGSALLSDAEVNRLVPLQTFLRANPLVAVRIEGYGDDSKATERNADLSLARAQSVARALLTDMQIANTIVATAAGLPQSRRAAAELTFTDFGGTGQ